MGQHYHQVSREDRFAIFFWLAEKVKKAEIARRLGFHRSTITREISRNSNEFGYTPGLAHQNAEKRRHEKATMLSQHAELKVYVKEKLKVGWSPELIAGRLRLENTGKTIISHETIYKYVYSPEGIEQRLYKFLLRHKPKRYPRIGRKKQNNILNRVFIQDRPEKINQRQTFGHWEGDLMIFKRHVQGNLITLRERKSRYILAIKNSTRQAINTAKNLTGYLNKNHGKSVKSLTLDNDTSFAAHEIIAGDLSAKIYFCQPYKSYQKGTIENGNRLLRQLFPREKDISKLSQTIIDLNIEKINQRPMRCLNYRTPAEVFYKFQSR